MRFIGLFLLYVISSSFSEAQNSSSYVALDLSLSARHAILNEPVSFSIPTQIKGKYSYVE